MVEYAAGLNGSLEGDDSQTVDHGSAASTVTAVADLGYHFVDWDDGSADNPRTDTNVTGPFSVVANFSINIYTVEYVATAGGAIIGENSQDIEHGSDGAEVTAVANTGWHFLNWSDGVESLSRTDENIASDLTITAIFEIDTHTLRYSVPGNVILSGLSVQVVNYGSSGSQVTVIPQSGYRFVRWSDGSTANPRVDSLITADLDVTAIIEAVPFVPPVIEPEVEPEIEENGETTEEGENKEGENGKFIAHITKIGGVTYLSEIRVIILDGQGNSIPNLNLTLFSDPINARTNNEGLAVFKNVPVGAHTLSLNHNGRDREFAVTIDEPEGEANVVELEFITIVVEEIKPSRDISYYLKCIGALVAVGLFALLWRRRKDRGEGRTKRSR